MKEYAIYPFEYLNISQNYNQGNHVPHWKNSKNYSDKPWDEALKDSGRDYFVPQNDFIVEEVLGINNNITNSVRLKSVNKLYMPYKNEPDYLCLTLTHMNEDNLKQVFKGQLLKKNSKILLEGTDGYATGNHFHITANTGKYYGLLKNSNGSWCYTYEKALTPSEAFYVDKKFTKVMDTKGSEFKTVPSEIPIVGNPVIRNENVDQIEVLATNLRCREDSSLKANITGYLKPGIYDYFGKISQDGYEWYKIEYGYVAFSSDWMILHPKKDIMDDKKDGKKDDEIDDNNDNSDNNDDNRNNNKDDNDSESESMKKCFIKIIMEFIRRLLKLKK